MSGGIWIPVMSSLMSVRVEAVDTTEHCLLSFYPLFVSSFVYFGPAMGTHVEGGFNGDRY